MDKRRAILSGALTVFARDGYTRASIDAISSAANVSTRTIYNHFQDKAGLFQSVIQESATSAAEAQIEIIGRYLDGLSSATDLEAALVEFGQAWSAPMADYADHLALVGHINADAGHIPQAAIDAWQRTGPMRVRRELAYRMRDLADHGLLRVDDPDRAALHFMLLISASRPFYHAVSLTEKEIAESVTAGVRTFLYGHVV